MKKVLAILIVVMIVALVGCSQNRVVSSDDVPSQSAEDQQEMNDASSDTDSDMSESEDKPVEIDSAMDADPSESGDDSPEDLGLTREELDELKQQIESIQADDLEALSE